MEAIEHRQAYGRPIWQASQCVEAKPQVESAGKNESLHTRILKAPEAGMQLRFYADPDTGQPHIYTHGVTEKEVEEVLRGGGENLPATGDARRKIGQTLGGRFLQV